MLINQGNLSRLFTSLKAALLDGIKEAPIPASAEGLVAAFPSQAGTDYFPTMALLGDLEELLDQYTTTDVAAYLQGIPNRFYGRELRIPKNHIEDDQIGMYARSLRRFGRLGATHAYRRIPQLFINGFATAWIDGANQFSTAHTWPGGQTWGNITFGPLNRLNWRAVLAKLFQRPAPDGQAMELAPTHLIFGQAYATTAKQIVGMETLPAGGGNPDYDPDVTLVKWSALTGAYARYWFVVGRTEGGGGEEAPIVILNRDEAALTSRTNPSDANVFHQETYEYKVALRYGRALAQPVYVEASQWGAEDVTTTTAEA